MSTTFVEILGKSSEKFFRTHSWEFPWNYSQDVLKRSSGISWNILSIFLSKFTNQDLLQLFRRISRNPFQGTRSFQGISCHQFQGISCYQFCRKTGENVHKISEILGNFQRKVLLNQFLGTIPKIFSRVPQEYLEIFSAYSWVDSLTQT